MVRRIESQICMQDKTENVEWKKKRWKNRTVSHTRTRTHLTTDRAQNRIGRGSGNVLNIEFVEGEINTIRKSIYEF